MADLKSFLRSQIGKEPNERPKKEAPVTKKPKRKAKPKAKKKQ